MPPSSLDFVDQRKGVFEGVLQETVLATYRRTEARAPASVHFIERRNGGSEVRRVGAFRLPAEPTAPWLLPRRPEEEALATQLRTMPHRLHHWGYSVSTGPLVWNRHKPQLRDKPAHGSVALVWAECVTNDGRFVFRAEKKNHTPYFLPREGDDWLIVRQPCVLLQRTTAKEQARRLIAAEMPALFVAAHGGVTVENHLNMLLPTTSAAAVPPAVVAAFLNSAAADRAFRCLSGSVAVSAYELEALPLPPPSMLGRLKKLVSAGAAAPAIEAACRRLYVLSDL
jgi:adenine-specific DNA-methyltransferase